MDSLLCGYLRFGKPLEKQSLEKQSLLFVVDTEATTSGGVQTANPVHAFPRLSSGNLSTATLTIDWGDGTSVVGSDGYTYLRGEYQEQEVSGSTINSHYSIARQE